VAEQTSEKIGIILRPEHKAALQDAADALGLSLGAYIRAAALQKAAREAAEREAAR
jgi:uncharacterized protein (DUF1778 family)